MKNLPTLLLLLSVLTTLSAQVDLETGLVAYYDFADHLNDLSSFQNNAYLNLGTTFVNDMNDTPNEAIYFDGSGTGSYVAIENASQLNFNPGEAFSISLWLKVPPTQNSTEGAINDIISKWSNSGNQPYSYTLRIYNQTEPERNGLVSAAIFESYAATCPVNALGILGVTPINDDNWHHVVFMRTEDRMLRLFVDCNLEAETQDNTTCNLSNSMDLTLGIRHLANTYRRPFTGSIDELRFYNRSLTEEECSVLAGKTLSQEEQEESNANCSLFPNPMVSGSNLFLFNQNNEPINRPIEVYTIAGQYLTTIQQGEKLSLPAGTYLVSNCESDQQQHLKKLVIIN
ncbi:LamG-like jellyroll fold domain-containing protein [Lewinella sp. LCG006]|uniref:LamG-like jellyroll fold domain-containing protein n=1 Tax=Lewinella sp. LCG006 TaxID=3231911 RepID=UPI00345F613F